MYIIHVRNTSHFLNFISNQILDNNLCQTKKIMKKKLREALDDE